MAALPVPDRTPSGPVAQISAFIAEFSVEVTRPSAADIAALAAQRPYVVRVLSPGKRGERAEFTDAIRGALSAEDN